MPRLGHVLPNPQTVLPVVDDSPYPLQFLVKRHRCEAVTPSLLEIAGERRAKVGQVDVVILCVEPVGELTPCSFDLV